MRVLTAAACFVPLACISASAGFQPNTAAGLAVEMSGRFQSIAQNVGATATEEQEARRIASTLFRQLSCPNGQRNIPGASSQDIINAMGEIAGDEQKPNRMLVAANMMFTAYHLRKGNSDIPELCEVARDFARR